MMNLLIRSLALASACVGAANAGIVYYTSSVPFQAAAMFSNTEDFEGLAVGFTPDVKTFSSNGISFKVLGGGAGQKIYIAGTGGGTQIQNSVLNNSQVLTASGDEDFQIRLVSGSTFTAIGFDFISNQYGGAFVDFYDSANHLIASHTLTQPNNTLGFFGAISDTPIDHIDTTVIGGSIEDTAYDNLQIGQAGTPEPASLWLGLSGLGLTIAGIRRRRRA